jgi:hypothetical protein
MPHSTIGSRKLAQSATQLRVAQRDALKGDTVAHRLDTHSMTNKGGSSSPLKIAGERDGTIRHNTIYQQKMKRNDIATNAGRPKRLSIFARQIASNPDLFDNAFRVQGVANQHPRSTIPASEGRRAMSISASRHGTPSDSSKPVKLPAFVAAQLRKTQKGR